MAFKISIHEKVLSGDKKRAISFLLIEFVNNILGVTVNVKCLTLSTSPSMHLLWEYIRHRYHKGQDVT